jgi:hypothetical protein
MTDLEFSSGKWMPELQSNCFDNSMLKKLTSDPTIMDIFSMVEDRYIYGKLSQMDESITVRWDIEKYGSQEVFGIRMDINDPDISETDLDELQLYVEIEDYLTKIVEKVVETLRIDEEGFDDAADFIEENVDSYACYINGEEYEL